MEYVMGKHVVAGYDGIRIRMTGASWMCRTTTAELHYVTYLSKIVSFGRENRHLNH